MDDLDGHNTSICNIVVVYKHGFKYWNYTRIGYTGDTDKLFWPFQSDWIPFFDKKYKVPALIS